MVHAALLLSGLMIALVGDAPASPHDIQTYEALKAKAGKDSQAQVKLALWCEAHGLTAERMMHLAQAMLADPKNVTARAAGPRRLRRTMGVGREDRRAGQDGRAADGQAGRIRRASGQTHRQGGGRPERRGALQGRRPA